MCDRPLQVDKTLGDLLQYSTNMLVLLEVILEGLKIGTQSSDSVDMA